MSVFQLARATRSGQQQGSATITIPDSAKAILEYIVDPLVVVSFYSCKRPVQEALRSALHRQFDQESIESANIGIGGIWAFLSDNRKTGQQIDGIPTQLLTPSSPRYLYLIPASTATAGGGQGQDSSLSFPDDDTVDLVGRILVGLMAVASTQLVVISENLQDAQDDLKVIGPAIELVVERATDVEPLLATYGHPTLSWRMGYDPSIADSSTAGSRTIAIQRLLSNQGNNSDNIRNLDVINRFFTLQDQAARSGYCESHTTPDMDMENMLTGGLQVLSINRDSTGQGKGTVLSEKDHGLHKSSLIPWIENTLSSVEGLLTTGDQFVNGLLLYANLQVSLTQLETIITFASSDPSSTYIDHSLLQQPQLHRQTLLSERILLNAGLTYHRVMNEYLDAMPIPLPSHTLAMIHSKAESAALSVAEVQCMGLSVDFDLKQLLLPKLRDMCLVADQQTTLAARTTAVTTVADAITISMEPTSGMYMEYWTANVLALKSYHSNLLDELWQATFSEEALDALDEEEGVAAETATAQDPLDRAGYLKDYVQFLRLSDQIRQQLLERCIPGPEASAALVTLNDMLQDESTGFMELLSSFILDNTSSLASTGSPNSPISITRHTSTNRGYRLSRLRTKEVETINDENNDSVVTGLDQIITETVQRPAITQPPISALERRIAEILLSKSSDFGNFTKIHDKKSSHRAGAAATEIPAGAVQARVAAKTHSIGKTVVKETDSRVVVQFGWTIHLLHANTQQYAWIWNWLYNHEGSSRQNAVACDSKMYTASKWIILPAKDLIRTRKDWKVSYGDRVWLVSYWFSTRNAKMELPEYLPLARGSPCRHVIPYGETYVICKTCPVDVLCMRCFRASDHTDHTMYLQCSWGTSVCVCEDTSRLKAHHSLHCSIHCAETHRTYSRLGKGKQCSMTFKTGEMVYHCQTCSLDNSKTAVLCARCFRSQNHFGHETSAQIAEEGATCSCHDNKSWIKKVSCAYHSSGQLGSEYMRQPLTLKDKDKDSLSTSKSSAVSGSNLSSSKSGNTSSLTAVAAIDSIPSSSSSTERHATKSIVLDNNQHRCGHVFKPGEDIYHCQDCSVDDRVVLCSRCFHASACISHRWRMGEFQGVGPRTKARATSSYPANSSDRDLSAMEGNNNQTSPRSDQTSGYPVATDVSSSLVDSLRIQSQPRISEKHQRDELDTAINANSTKTTDTEQEEVERGDPDEGQSPVSDVTCDCGDPSLFKTAFDCNYHLPDEYRPVPHLVQCNYLFLKGDTMYRCLTCELAPATSDSTSSELIGERSLSEALWTCERCFDMDAHRDHKFEEFTNKRNEGLYCHCGSPDNCRSACSKSDTPKITPSPPVTQGEDKEEDEDESEDSDAIETECCDDHNRQTILCSKEIKEGTYYYKCESCQTDPTRVFCDPCFVKEAHVGHLYQRLCAPPVAFPVLGPGFDHNQQSNHSLPPTLQCACGENSAFRFATHCKQHERTGGTNVVLRCRYRARAGEWIAHCRTCFPDMSLGGHDPYLCMRCRQASDHQDHDITWAKTELDCIDHCSCGASQATGTTYDSEETDSIAAKGEDGEDEEEEDDDDDEHDPEFAPFSPSSSSATSSNHCGPILELRPLCSYHTMIYKTTPSTTLYLHSHQHRSINHQDHNEVSGYRYHNRDNDWIVSRPDKIANKPCSAASPSSSSSSSPSPSSSSSSSTSTQQEKGQQKQNDEESSKSLSPSLPLTNPLSPPPSPYLKWKDVFWLQHGQTGQFLNSMASLRINQGFQEISTLDGPHSNNDWIVEETTWLRQQILSDE